jgi:hypothetical protein
MNATPDKPDPQRHAKSSFTVYGRGSDAESQREHTHRLFNSFWEIHEGFADAKLDGKTVKPRVVRGEQNEVT